MERHWLAFDETAQLPALMFGSGAVEVTSASSGAASGGGTVSWVQYFERSDDLGMWHVYYRQEYSHPQLGRAVPVLGTSLSLHFAPDGELRRANLAQLTDVPPLPQPTVTTAPQAFAVAQSGLASWPGFAPGNPATWDAGTMATILDHSQLSLATLPETGTHRWQWLVPTIDAHGRPWRVLLDAVTGAIIGVVPGNPSSGLAIPCFPNPVADEDASAAPENTCVPVRAVWANPCASCQYPCSTCQYDSGNPCGDGTPCTHEAVAEGGDGSPQIEVYHGMPSDEWHYHCIIDGDEGKFMRVGLRAVPGQPEPRYDTYSGKRSGGWAPHAQYRRMAGDAMHNTRKTMEVFRDAFGWCGVDGSCATARVVVDARDGEPAEFQYGPTNPVEGPVDSVTFLPPDPDGTFSKSAALDVVAHEWTHGVSKHSPVDFHSLCAPPAMSEPCEMAEGFADVVGHYVERKVHTTDPPPPPACQEEHRDWIAGEDWDPDNHQTRWRRADQFDQNDCTPFHWSVHTSDDDCYEIHSVGNRLAVAFRLMAEGGRNPGHQNPGCPGCPDLLVTPLEPDPPATSLDIAATILWRVLTVEGDAALTDWDYLPFYAHQAIKDLYPPLSSACEAAQTTMRDAFRAVGYPESLPSPGVHCSAPQPCPPVCDE